MLKWPKYEQTIKWQMNYDRTFRVLEMGMDEKKSDLDSNVMCGNWEWHKDGFFLFFYFKDLWNDECGN